MKNALVLGLIAVRSSGSGCSLLFVEGPPAEHVGSQPLTCSTSYGWPVVDTLKAETAVPFVAFDVTVR